jgi:hypothetical protein
LEERFLTEALAVYREIGDRLGEAYGLAARARLAAATGDQNGAAADMAEAARILTAINLTERAEQLPQEAAGWAAGWEATGRASSG